MPVIFLGHGNPMNALESNPYTNAWRELGASIPAPKAVVCISAHWYIEGTMVTAMPRPRTIHDFYGFPPELFHVTYPAPGNPALASTVKDLLAPLSVGLDRGNWGLDHGTWSVLVHVFPAADIPTIQLSIDATKPASYHLDLGRRLAPLRDQGVLLLGSGNVVHNLSLADFDTKTPYDWATRFDADVHHHLNEVDDQALVEYQRHPDGKLAVPTPEHYLPLLYVVGARLPGDKLDVLVEGIDLRSVSMTAYRLG